VYPSLEDIFSLSLVEAAASGVPSIAFDIEANSEILDDNISGKIVKKPDEFALSQAIDFLLDDEKLLDRISDNAKKLIPIKFNWDKTTSILESYYKELT